MQIEVAYAEPQQQWVQLVELPEGATVAQALAAVATQDPFERLDLAQMPVGVFGEEVQREHPLQPFDRVELYRSLRLDPKEARRQRAANNTVQT